ncbi:MAG: protein kinase, partial [Polyangiaceae bacterium]
MTVALCPHCGQEHETDGCTRSEPSRIGQVLEGKYELLRLIGAGGMGEVYEARHRQLRRRVAIKFLRPKYAAEPEFCVRFENEARAAAALEHENVASVFDVGKTDDGARYLVMEFLAGEDCAALMARQGTLAEAHAARLALQ